MTFSKPISLLDNDPLIQETIDSGIISKLIIMMKNDDQPNLQVTYRGEYIRIINNIARGCVDIDQYCIWNN